MSNTTPNQDHASNLTVYPKQFVKITIFVTGKTGLKTLSNTTPKQDHVSNLEALSKTIPTASQP
ncbi:MAG: hypothetical protein PHW83_10560 [Bacteroidales bacterium]|nr:hypothetical protein [Bacteroidales bacterium]